MPKHMRILMVVKKILPVLWLIALYAGTIWSAGISNAPEDFWERVAFELLHAAVHFSLFAVMLWLTAVAATSAWLDHRLRTVALVLGTAILLGLAQEWMQTYLRSKLYAMNSLWDIGMDAMGGGYGWWLAAQRQLKNRVSGLPSEGPAHLEIQPGED